MEIEKLFGLTRDVRRKLVLLVFRFLCLRPVNILLKGMMTPFKMHLPNMVVERFPISGDIHVDLPGVRSLVFRTDGRDAIASRMYWRGIRAHEPETIDLFAQLVSSVDVVLDVGASTGLFAMVASVINPDVKVHAFEPVPETYDFLVENISVNGLRNIEPIKACITNYDGKISVYPNRTPILPFQTSTRANYQSRLTPREVPSRALTLDSYVAAQHIENVGLLKIDAEASDHTVLEGAKRILERDRANIICEVLYNDTDHLIQNFFEGMDFRYFRIVNGGLKAMTEVLGDSEYVYRNYLFVHESRLPSVQEFLTE